MEVLAVDEEDDFPADECEETFTGDDEPADVTTFLVVFKVCGGVLPGLFSITS